MAWGITEVFSGIWERNKQAGSLSKAISISVLNQAVSSGTNFILGIYLVRVLTPEQFGLYGIGFAISLFYAGIGSSLFLTQMVVNAPDKPLDERLTYAASMGKAVAVFCALTVLISLLVLPGLGAIWPWFGNYTKYGFAVTAASVGYLLKDFFVRHAYTTRKEIWALEINVAVAASLAVLLMLQYQQSIEIMATGALCIYALCHLAAAATGQILSQLPLLAVQGNKVLRDTQEAWVQGRWALMTTMMYSLRTQAYIFVTAWGVGPSGVAYLNAARLLVTPASMLTPAISQVFMPRLAELRKYGRGRVVKVGTLFTVLLLGVALIYSGTLLVLLNHVVPLVLGTKYDSVFGIVFGWSVVMCFLAVRNGGELILQALKSFRSLMIVNAVSALIAIIAVVGLLGFVGLYGPVYGLALAELFLAVVYIWIIYNNEE